VFINMLFPALEAPSIIIEDHYVMVSPDHEEIKWLNVFYVVVRSLTRLAWIASGAVLIWSVNRVRTFLKSRNEDGEEINLKSLIIHSTAFFLYAASLLIYVVFYDRHEIECRFKKKSDNPNCPKYQKQTDYADSSMFIC